MKRKRNVGTLVEGQARENTVRDQIELKNLSQTNCDNFWNARMAWFNEIVCNFNLTDMLMS